MLEKDTQNFLKFFADIKKETTAATSQLENFKKERNEKTMILRGINDQCAALQSKINKKIEILITYNIYKDFLDDLRPKEIKEAEALARAEKLEVKERNRVQSKSLEMGGAQRRGTRLDPSRSITAQGRAANAASSQGEVDAQAH